MSVGLRRRALLAAGATGSAVAIAWVAGVAVPSTSGFQGRLTHWPIGVYPAVPLVPTAEGPIFNALNARAMAWAAQLAYEVGTTADEQAQLKTVLANWRWDLLGASTVALPRGLSGQTARVFVARAGASQIVAFPGTEPKSWSDWLTDIDIQTCGTDGVHAGFANYADAVCNDVQNYVQPGPGDVFITGHSLGGAVAAVAALRLVGRGSFVGKRVHVLTFGMPRAGSEAFASRYRSAGLGDNTCRFMHGTDIVPSLPPHALKFRHVGRSIACTSNGQFNLQDIAEDNEEPQIRTDEWQAYESVLLNWRGLATCRKTPKFPGNADVENLPCVIRDHLPDCYLRALGESLGTAA